MIEVIQGDAREVLAGMAAGSVQCCVTSPPYWGLRDYGIEPSVWTAPDLWECPYPCEHEWGTDIVTDSRGTQIGKATIVDARESARGQFCVRCGAWLGCLGLEPTPELYVQHIVEVFRGVRRVLRDDAVCWVNLGDSYFGGGRGGNPEESPYRKQATNAGSLIEPPDWRSMDCALKPKDLCMMPARVAMALQADGWYLRSDIIWAKGLSFCDSYSGSVMPESCRDRPTSAYEHVFMLTKSARYFYDWFAAREQGVWPAGTMAAKGSGTREGNRRAPGYVEYSGTRNWRNVWVIGPKPFKAAHFATYPPELAEKCIVAGSSPYACPTCGAPYERVVAGDRYCPPNAEPGERMVDKSRGDKIRKLSGKEFNEQNKQTHTAWRTTCAHAIGNPGRCVVLDPFGGSGTTGVAAKTLGRDCTLIEINPDYCEMARKRCRVPVTQPLFR